MGFTKFREGGSQTPGGGNTDLAVTRNANSVTVTSSTGSNAAIPAASATQAGVLQSSDKVKLNRYDPAANEISEVWNVENEQTAGSGGAIEIGNLLRIAGTTVQTVDGIDYIGVVSEAGSVANLGIPDGLAVKAIALDSREEDAMLVKGVTTITQSGLGTLPLNSKLYLEETGSGASATWQFTAVDHPGSHHVGRVMNDAAGDDYIVYLDFTLAAASFHIKSEIAYAQKSVRSIIAALPASPTNGDRHIITAAGTDQNKIVERVGTTWVYSTTPLDGWIVYVQDVESLYTYNSSNTAWESNRATVSNNGTDVLANVKKINFINGMGTVEVNSNDPRQVDVNIDPGVLFLQQSSGETMLPGTPAVLSGTNGQDRAAALDLTGDINNWPLFWAGEEIANNASGEFVREGRIANARNVENGNGNMYPTPPTLTNPMNLYWRQAGGTFTTVAPTDPASISKNDFVGLLTAARYVMARTTFYDATLLISNTGISTLAGANAAKNATIVAPNLASAGTRNFQIPNLTGSNDYETTFVLGDRIAFANPTGTNMQLVIQIASGGTMLDIDGNSVVSQTINENESIILEEIAGNIWKVVAENTDVVEFDIAVSIDHLNTSRLNVLDEIVAPLEPLDTELNDIREYIFNGLDTQSMNNDTIRILPGECGGHNGELITVSANIDLQLTAGNLDTGSETSSTWYYIWIFKSSTGTGTTAKFSTSNSAPTTPSGFTARRLLGAVYNDSSSNFRPFRCYGAGNSKTYSYNVETLSLSNQTIAGRVAVDCSQEAPHLPVIGFPFIEVSFEFDGGNLLAYHADQNSTFVFVPAGSEFALFPNVQLNSSGQFHISNSGGNVTALYMKVLGFKMELY